MRRNRSSVEYSNRGSIDSTTFDNDCCGGPTARSHTSKIAFINGVVTARGCCKCKLWSYCHADHTESSATAENYARRVKRERVPGPGNTKRYRRNYMPYTAAIYRAGPLVIFTPNETRAARCRVYVYSWPCFVNCRDIDVSPRRVISPRAQFPRSRSRLF